MQSIVSKGKDINEAIALGLELLEATKKEVNIEIVQQGTRGFMGVGSKKAVVKLTKVERHSDKPQKKATSAEYFTQIEQLISTVPNDYVKVTEAPAFQQPPTMINSLEKKETDLAGKVWVKDGQLYCRSSPTHFPMVTIREGVTLLKNGKVVLNRNTIVSEKDLYEIKVKSEEKETIWKVTMEDNGLKVLLHVHPGYKIYRHIPDIEADHRIELVVEERKEVENTLEYMEVIKQLESLGVKHGFNQDEMIKATEATTQSVFEIATGVKTKEGKDGWIEIIVDMNKSEGTMEMEGGRVDYRETKTIPTAEIGKVIAIVHPPIPGECGYKVTNEPLPAKQTFPIILHTGKGVTLVDNKIVATESGRPHIEKRGMLVKVSIMPKLIHPRDVDISSGNIHFKGDVEILGQVGEGMLVETQGDILVQKSVNMATLTASGAIISYGTIIGSEISAGKSNILIAELGQLLGTLHQRSEKMITLIHQLTQSRAFKDNDFSRVGLQPLIRILLEKKFQSFPVLVKKYVDIVKRGEEYIDDDQWREVAGSLSQIYLSLMKESISFDRVIDLSQKMKELHEMSKTPVEPDSYITIPNAFNSRIYCSGNVLILGQGCINTKIHAGGLLKINGTIRGGVVYGRLGAEINETGAESGTPTMIAVAPDQRIYIKKAIEGTSIKIGNVPYTFKETRYNISARLDEHDRIVFH